MLFLIVANFLIRSGRLDKYILFFKRRLKRNVTAISKPAVVIMFLLMIHVIASGITHRAPNDEKVSVEGFPIPSINNQLFYLQRDPDANTLIYKLNMKGGQVDSDNPVNVFWIRYAENGELKPLSAIQRKLAYGIKTRLIEAGKHELRFVSFPRLPLYLVKSGSNNGSPANRYYVYANIEDRQMILNRVFVRIQGGSFIMPNVLYIELNGKDSQTGKPFVHRINV